MCLLAQEETKDSVSVDVSKNTDIPEVQTANIAKLQNQIQKLSAEVAQLSESEKELKGKDIDNSIIIEEQKAVIKRLENRLIFADSIIARLSNDCLRKKYDAVNVNIAINNFEKMYSPELKSKFGRLIVLLKEYGKYTSEIESILIEAQNDKALSNPFTGQKQALTYIDKIKSTSYYRNVYGDNWTIPYLNSIIDKSIETIKSFNPRKSKELHLIDLMK